MRTKLFYGGGILFAAALLLLGGILLGVILLQQKEGVVEETPSQIQETVLAPEVEAVLDRKISLVAELLADPVILDGVRAANQEHANTSLEEILELDEKWRNTEGADEFIEAFLGNDVARKLMEFQEQYPGFSEIFVVDARGLNVGQTNKTTDYYQADEDWWVGAYDEGRGKAFYGFIEFDESAQAEAISLYVPVRDPNDQNAIGVAKAVVSIVAIKMEL
ncbi:MAG TPA: hypothetical protein VJC15_00290 [Candidatus Paceibacterota bacterium]